MITNYLNHRSGKRFNWKTAREFLNAIFRLRCTFRLKLPVAMMKSKLEKESKLGKFLTASAMTGLLASCAQMGSLEAHNANTRKAAESAQTYADHDRLAKQYENTARELLVKAERQKELLQHYEEKSYLYGKQAQDRQSHTSALLNKYRRTAEEAIKLAALHQKIASELAKGDCARNYRESRDGFCMSTSTQTVSTCLIENRGQLLGCI